MKATVAKWSLVLLCASMGAAIGGGLYEHVVLTPIWAASPPASFTIIQPETGVPLQRFWIPVHAAITVFAVVALFATWKQVKLRRLLIVGLASYIVMRTWSGVYFIPEMLAFQKIAPDTPPSAALSARVSRWTGMTVWREPLDVISFLCFSLALFWLRRLHKNGEDGVVGTQEHDARPTALGDEDPAIGEKIAAIHQSSVTRIHVCFVRLDVLQRIHRADGKLATEISADAEQLDHIELSAQPAQQFNRRVDRIRGRAQNSENTERFYA